MFLRKSEAPRTSPYRVAPQLDHRLKKTMKGIEQEHPAERAEGADVAVRTSCAGVDRPLVGVRTRPQHLLGLRVERRDEVRLRVDEQEDEQEREPQQSAVEADLLDPGVGPDSERDEHRGQQSGEDRCPEQPLVLGEECHAAVPSDDRRQRDDHLDVEDVRVDGDPVPEDEPPSARGEDEADPAAQHAADPDVVAAGPGHGRHEGGVGDRLKEQVAAGKDHRPQEAALRDEDRVREDEEAERDEVDREERVDERVPDRPTLYQAGRLAGEERRLN